MISLAASSFPCVRLSRARAYAATGISTEHECTTADEAREKLRLGLKIMIREGSQARNLEALLPAVRPETLDQFMFAAQSPFAPIAGVHFNRHRRRVFSWHEDRNNFHQAAKSKLTGLKRSQYEPRKDSDKRQVISDK